MASFFACVIFVVISALSFTPTESQEWPYVKDAVCENMEYCVFPLNETVNAGKKDYKWLNRTVEEDECTSRVTRDNCGCLEAENVTRQTLVQFFGGSAKFMQECESLKECNKSRKCKQCLNLTSSDIDTGSCCKAYNHTVHRLRQSKLELQSACRLICRGNMRCGYIACKVTTLHHGKCETPATASQGDQDVVVGVLGALLALLVVIVTAFFLVWLWRRRRVKTGNAKSNSSSCGGPSPAEDIDSPLSSQDGGPSSSQNKRATSGPENPTNINGGHRYTQIDSVTNMRPKYELQESDDSVYNEPDDVTNRKLPPTPGQNDSQAEEDVAIVAARKLPSAPLSGDYSFAHNPTEETVFTAQDANGKTGRKASKELQSKDGCTFFLDEEEANGKNDSNKMTRPHAAAVAAASSDRSSHDYSALDSSDRARNSNSHDGEYTPLGHTPDEEQGDKPEDLNDVDGAKGQYFVLENTNDGGETQDDTANEPEADEQGKDGQYFILEENA